MTATIEKTTVIKVDKNFSFACVLDEESQAKVGDAIYAAHRYRNALCEIELAHRKRHEEMLKRLVPEYFDLQQLVEKTKKDIEEVYRQISALRSQQKTKKPVGVESLSDRAKQLKASLKVYAANLKVEKSQAYKRPDVIKAIEENQILKKSEMMKAKDQSGLWWPTEACVQSSCRSFSSGAPPRFKKYDGEGQIAVQFQNGMTVEKFSRENTLCFIGQKVGKYTELYIRIGSGPKNKPVFAKAKVILHRSVDGLLKWGYIERRKMADRTKWTFRTTATTEVSVDRDVDSYVALHVGWLRKDDGSIRSAIWKGSDGQTGEVFVDASSVKQYKLIDTVVSWRSVAFNDARQLLLEYLAQNPSVPSEMREDAKHAILWRSPRKLVAYLNKWKDSFSGITTQIGIDRISYYTKHGRYDSNIVQTLRDEGIALENESYYGRRKPSIYANIGKVRVRVSTHNSCTFEGLTFGSSESPRLIKTVVENGYANVSFIDLLSRWVQNDKVLWRHESRLRLRLAGRRNSLYRNLAKQLSDKYGVAFICKIEAEKLSRVASPDIEDSATAEVRRASKIAAVSTLIRYVEEKFPLHAIDVSSVDLTVECSKCGSVNEYPSKDRSVLCSCGSKWDIDENALENTIRRGLKKQAEGAIEDNFTAHAESVSKRTERLKRMQEANRQKRKMED